MSFKALLSSKYTSFGLFVLGVILGDGEFSFESNSLFWCHFGCCRRWVSATGLRVLFSSSQFDNVFAILHCFSIGVDRTVGGMWYISFLVSCSSSNCSSMAGGAGLCVQSMALWLSIAGDGVEIVVLLRAIAPLDTVIFLGFSSFSSFL